MGRTAFETFVPIYFKSFYGADHFRSLPELGSGVYERDLTDNLFPPDAGQDGHYGLFEALYFVHLFPIELFKNPEKISIEDPDWVELFKRALSAKSRFSCLDLSGSVLDRLQNVFFLSNHFGAHDADYQQILLPKYQSLINRLGYSFDGTGVGSPDSFIARGYGSLVEKAVNTFVSSHKDGICIQLGDVDSISVRPFTSQKQLANGVSHKSHEPFQPTIIDKSGPIPDAILEFECLLKKQSSEVEIEKFLVANYREVFGAKFDRIEPQIWLRFPQLDISGENRRMDLFIRNSISNDWELFEIKKSMNITGTYRDVPVIAKEVLGAVQQVKNYARILSQDPVKRKFASEGIEYYEPVLHLVVGRKPQIEQEQWRWLMANFDKDVHLLLYDDMLQEMKIRKQWLENVVRGKSA